MTSAGDPEKELFPLSRPAAGAEKGLPAYTCIGPSMFPTIKVGDVIVVAPRADRPVRRGDVIVFGLRGEGRVICHRVMKVRGASLTARGDSNSLQDPWRLSLDDVVGRVTFRKRRGRIQPVAGGWRGSLQGLAFRSAAVTRLTLMRLLRPAYLWAAENGIFWRVVPFRLKTRLVDLRRPWGRERLLMAGRMIIARRPADGKSWLIRRPFKLLIDPRTLP